jgi:glycosyltransferase involved in cell wall biosynthesis
VRVLIVSGIWPPDVGGPASHAPDVADFLRSQGHAVEVVTTASAPPASTPYPVRWTSRRLPIGVRHFHALALIAWRARGADVIYTTGMFGRSGLAALLSGRPFVMKLTGDPAFERLRARARVAGDVDTFQRDAGGRVSTRALRRFRNWVVQRADHIFTPSGYLRELVIGWGVAPERVSVLPNPAPAERPSATRGELREQFGVTGDTLAFAGRLTAQKSLGVMLAAVAASPGVTLLVAGDGDEADVVAATVASLGLADRVMLLGPVSRNAVLDVFAAADASILTSSWENFPHSVVESLAVGTPVIATRAGGVAEVVQDGVNGLLVDVGNVDGVIAAIRRYFADGALRRRLRSNAAQSVEGYSPAYLLGRIADQLEDARR